jgi:hypothetical protein
MSVMILSHSGCSCRSPYILPPCSGALITQQHLCEALPSLRDEKSKSYAISVFCRAKLRNRFTDNVR